MRTNIKSKFGFLVSLLTLFVITSSCEKDLYEDGIKNNSKKLSVKLVSLKSDLSKSNSKLTKALNQLNQKQKNEENRIVYDSILNFYFDDEKGIYIEDGIKNSYTFPVFRDSTDVNDNIENLIFDLNSNGEYDIYLVKYDISIANLSNISFQEFEQIEKEYMAIQVEGRATLDLVCIDVQQYLLVSDSSGNSMSTTAPTYYYDWVTTSSQCGWVSGNSEPINTNTGTNGGTSSYGGTGGGASSNSTNIYTGVVSLSPEELSIKNFILNLPDDLVDWFVDQPVEFQNEVYLYITNNNFSDESKEEIENIIDILDDGMVDGEPVLVGPNDPIDDMEEYLSCFNTSLGATITIYADQPKAGSHNLTGPDRVGHTFISIQQGDNIASFGFYPISSLGSVVPNHATILNPLDFLSTPGVFENNQGHGYDVSLSIPISPSDLTSLINGVISIAENSPMYNIGQLNCTDVALLIFEGNTSVDIPSCESPRPYWDGQTPGTLGEVIRNLPLPSGATKNTTGGTAPNNNCN